MPQKDPFLQTTLVVLLGASEWPRFPELQSSKAFANSASQLKAYLLSPHQFGLSAENLLDLFDADQSADDIDSTICEFLDQRTTKMKTSGNAARNLLVYYVGHGGFIGPQSDYYLAIRRTRSNNPRASSIGIVSLADTLKEKARRLRRFLILDCCFAAAAFQSFQSGPSQVAIQQAIAAFKEKSEEVGYPERGTALLCSSGPKVPSLISQDGTYTMFTEALLRALTTGNPRQQNKSYLSLRELTNLIADFLTDSPEKNAPRPHLHSPDQSDGDIADVPFFPNLCVQEEAIHQVKEEMLRKIEEMWNKPGQEQQPTSSWIAQQPGAWKSQISAQDPQDHLRKPYAEQPILPLPDNQQKSEEILRCSLCNTPYELGDKICSGCGGTLPLRCFRCGAPYEPGATICNLCGTIQQQSRGSDYDHWLRIPDNQQKSEEILRCSLCNTPYELGDTFCSGCGRTLQQS